MLSFENLNALVRREMPPGRVLHVLGVAQEAVTLALRWNADPDEARRAALLHDITKEKPGQLKLCEDYGIMADIWQRRNEKLLHSVTGAEYAKRCGASHQVVQAVRWHTTGRPNMTVLEKIIYLADCVEPTRRPLPNLDRLRAAVYDDLDAAMLLGLTMTLEHLLARRLAIHPDSWNAHEFYLETGNGKGLP